MFMCQNINFRCPPFYRVHIFRTKFLLDTSLESFISKINLKYILYAVKGFTEFHVSTKCHGFEIKYFQSNYRKDCYSSNAITSCNKQIPTLVFWHLVTKKVNVKYTSYKHGNVISLR